MHCCNTEVYRNLLKISPLSKIWPSPFFEWSCCKVCFSLESTPTHLCCSTCCYVKQEAPKKQQQREGRHAPLLLLRKQAHDKRGIAESLHAQITRTRLTACEVGIFSREISQLLKICPPPSFSSHLSSSPMGVFSRDYGMYVCMHACMYIYHTLPGVGSGTCGQASYTHGCIDTCKCLVRSMNGTGGVSMWLCWKRKQRATASECTGRI